MRYLIGRFTQDQGVEIRRIITRRDEIEQRRQQVFDAQHEAGLYGASDETFDRLADEDDRLSEEWFELGEQAIGLLADMELDDVRG